MNDAAISFDGFLPPEPIADFACRCGEGPLWHPAEQVLYWVDIPTGRVLRYDPHGDNGRGTSEQVWAGEEVGGLTLQADGSLLLFLARGAIKIRKPNGDMETVVEEIEGEQTTRFNDVIADPEGRVFCGTMPTRERKGRLYRLERDGSLHIVRENVGCANGMGFTPDRKQMYFTDTPTRQIVRFDYDVQTGALTNETVFANVSADAGHGAPDGMTVDKNWRCLVGPLGRFTAGLPRPNRRTRKSHYPISVPQSFVRAVCRDKLFRFICDDSGWGRARK